MRAHCQHQPATFCLLPGDMEHIANFSLVTFCLLLRYVEHNESTLPASACHLLSAPRGHGAHFKVQTGQLLLALGGTRSTLPTSAQPHFACSQGTWSTLPGARVEQGTESKSEPRNSIRIGSSSRSGSGSKLRRDSGPGVGQRGRVGQRAGVPQQADERLL